jgi:hypothetical protein
VGTLLFVVAVHSVFESQARHHQPLYGVFALFAATAIWRPSGDSADSSSRDEL